MGDSVYNAQLMVDAFEYQFGAEGIEHARR